MRFSKGEPERALQAGLVREEHLPGGALVGRPRRSGRAARRVLLLDVVARRRRAARLRDDVHEQLAAGPRGRQRALGRRDHVERRLGRRAPADPPDRAARVVPRPLRLRGRVRGGTLPDARRPLDAGLSEPEKDDQVLRDGRRSLPRCRACSEASSRTTTSRAEGSTASTSRPSSRSTSRRPGTCSSRSSGSRRPGSAWASTSRPMIGGREPKRQGLLVDLLWGALVVVARRLARGRVARRPGTARRPLVVARTHGLGAHRARQALAGPARRRIRAVDRRRVARASASALARRTDPSGLVRLFLVSAIAIPAMFTASFMITPGNPPHDVRLLALVGDPPLGRGHVRGLRGRRARPAHGLDGARDSRIRRARAEVPARAPARQRHRRNRPPLLLDRRRGLLDRRSGASSARSRSCRSRCSPSRPSSSGS